MNRVAAIVPVCPLRSEPSHRAEMVSQILFGESASVLEISGDFSKIKMDFDGYEGWVQSTQLTAADTNFPLLGYAVENGYLKFKDQPMFISAGTPVLQSAAIGRFPVDYSAILFKKNIPFTGKSIQKLANPYINASYLWGGRSAFGVDCSGFAQQIFKFFDVDLPRDAYQQALVGDAVDFLEEVVSGDLAFFDNEEGRIVHVGILLDKAHVLHSSGKVRMDKIDAQGIVNVDTGMRTHSLRIIKRIA